MVVLLLLLRDPVPNFYIILFIAKDDLKLWQSAEVYIVMRLLAALVGMARFCS